MKEKIEIFPAPVRSPLLLKGICQERYWMIIGSCENVMASNFQRYDRTIGVPKAENGESEGRG